MSEDTKDRDSPEVDPPAADFTGDNFTGAPPTDRDDGGGEVAEDRLPSQGLLSFYDRLRQRVHDFLEERGGSLGSTATDYLMLVPDVFILLARLSLDKQVPKEQRVLIGGALAYFVIPIDLLPEAMLGPVGYLDDLVLSAVVLSKAFGEQLEPYTDHHWSGSAKLRTVLADVAQAAESLVGKDIYGKLMTLLRKKGLDVDTDQT
jgi:uncharacterized membrane protein YkvA (DUF1232 family)